MLPLTSGGGGGGAVIPKFKGNFLGEGDLERRTLDRVSSTVL